MLKLNLIVILAIFIAHIECMPSPHTEGLVKPNTPVNIARLNNISEDDLAEELSGQFEGDIIISQQQMEELTGRNGRTGLLNTRYRWTDNIVPYRINETYFDASQIEYIHMGVKKLEEATCLKFVAYDSQIHEDFVTIEGRTSGCWSYVGRQGGEQLMNLQPYERELGCFRLYTIVHEFIHAVGFFHQQSATERDEYVDIIWEKITAGTENNFNKYDSTYITNYGVEYDYGSVMHYGKTAFSIDGSDTIVPKKDLNGEIMGQRTKLSDRDALRINHMYCEPLTTTTEETEKPTTRFPLPGELFRTINEFVQNIMKNVFGSINFK